MGSKKEMQEEDIDLKNCLFMCNNTRVVQNGRYAYSCRCSIWKTTLAFLKIICNNSNKL